MPNGMGLYQDEFMGCFKRKFRWLLKIPEVSAMGAQTLPPLKSARPSLSFKEMEVPHLNENIFFPVKPEWKPITLTLFDISKGKENPVFSWLRQVYNPVPAFCSAWNPVNKVNCFIELYDGCGNLMEQWTLEHAYPQAVDFEDLDMGSSDIVTCQVTLRYDRAYISFPVELGMGPPPAQISVCSEVSLIGGVGFHLAAEPVAEPVIMTFETMF